jgi:hypothetical protein
MSSDGSLEVFQTIFKYTIYWRPNIHFNLRCGDGLVECSDGLVHRCPYVSIAPPAHVDGSTAPKTTGGFFRSLLTVIVMTFWTSSIVSNRFTDRPKMPKSPNLRNAKRFVGCSALENTSCRWRCAKSPFSPHDTTHIFSRNDDDNAIYLDTVSPPISV